MRDDEDEDMRDEEREDPQPGAPGADPGSRKLKAFVRHEDESPEERSTCGVRRRLLSRADAEAMPVPPAAWVHTVEIEGAAPHYHRRATEIYYVLEGEGEIVLDGEAHAVRPGSLVYIPPGVVHAARGRLRLLVAGIPDISDDDVYHPRENGRSSQSDVPAG